LLCIIQPARGLCSWADLLALTAGCEKGGAWRRWEFK
jgi:hypothetical protein